MADNNVNYVTNSGEKTEFTVSVYSLTGVLLKEYSGQQRGVKVLDDIAPGKFVFRDAMGAVHTIKNAIVIVDDM